MNSLLFATVLFLAATNGANDNFKGVATLYGSRIAGYWTSLIFASAATLAGALCSFYLAKTLLVAFTGKGLVTAAVSGQGEFALSVAGGAALTVALAAWRGLPISTTHALVGAMSGAALVALGRGVHFETLGASFLLPLVASPIVAIVPAWAIAKLLPHPATPKDPICVCVSDGATALAGGAILSGSAQIVANRTSVCGAQGARPLFQPDTRRLVNAMQFMLAGTVSFARGLNDTPKIAALLLPVAALDVKGSICAVAIAMLIGAMLGASRVARTMSYGIATLHLPSALSASLVTGLLVGTASVSGLPVSTTHVSVGALVGGGSAAGGVNRSTLKAIVAAWLITLPTAAIFGASVYLLVH